MYFCAMQTDEELIRPLLSVSSLPNSILTHMIRYLGGGDCHSVVGKHSGLPHLVTHIAGQVSPPLLPVPAASQTLLDMEVHQGEQLQAHGTVAVVCSSGEVGQQ